MPLIKFRQIKIDQINEQLELLNEKITRLRKQYVIEAGISVKFQLEKEIEQNEKERDFLEKQLEHLENELKNPFDFNNQTIQDYIKYYNTLAKRDPRDGNIFYTLGLFYLKLKLYDFAKSNFEQAIDLMPDEADIYYYYALSLIQGRRPKTMTLKEVKFIEKCVDTSIHLDDSQAKYYYLLVILKFDYYLLNGLTVPPPSLNDLLIIAQIKEYDPIEIEILLQSVILRDETLLSLILRKSIINLYL